MLIKITQPFYKLKPAILNKIKKDQKLINALAELNNVSRDTVYRNWLYSDIIPDAFTEIHNLELIAKWIYPKKNLKNGFKDLIDIEYKYKMLIP